MNRRQNTLRPRRGFLAPLLGFALLAAASLPAAAQSAIRVVVNEVPITKYDIDQRAKFIVLTQRKASAVARKEAEQELIDDQVKLAEAKRVGIDVSAKEVNNAYARIATNVKMSPSQLSSALQRGGVSPDTLKNRLKAQLAWNQLVSRRFNGSVRVDEFRLSPRFRSRTMKRRTFPLSTICNG